MANRMTINYEKKPCYDIVFARDFSLLAEELTELGVAERKIAVICDSNTEKLFGEEVTGSLEKCCKKVILHAFPAGEANKTLDTVKEIYRRLIEEKFDRKDLLVALGGGVVGDIVGYTAATYLRGVDFIQIPTTLLAQSDSSIGGKTGVDFDGYKNMVGAFYMPKLVYMNTGALKSLEDRQFYAGFAEIMKAGLIKDAGFYEWLLDHMYEIHDRDMDVCEEMVMRSCGIKKLVVEKDPFSILDTPSVMPSRRRSILKCCTGNALRSAWWRRLIFHGNMRAFPWMNTMKCGICLFPLICPSALTKLSRRKFLRLLKLIKRWRLGRSSLCFSKRWVRLTWTEPLLTRRLCRRLRKFILVMRICGNESEKEVFSVSGSAYDYRAYCI